MLDALTSDLLAARHGDAPAIAAAPGWAHRVLARATVRERAGLSARTILTRGQLGDLVADLGRRLHHAGLGPGDTIAVAVRPGPTALALLLAAHRLRVVVAMIDPYAGPQLVRARLRSAGVRLVIADGAAQAAAGWAAPLARRAGLELPTLSDIAPVFTLGRRTPGCAPSLARGSGGPIPDRGGDPGDAVVIFTSGTTSAPRGVVQTAASLDSGFADVATLVQPRPGAAVLGGTFFTLIPALAAGAPVVLPPRDPARLARLLRATAASSAPFQAIYLTPPQLREALRHDAQLSGRVFCGSAPVAADLLVRARQAGADQAWGVYALTECFPVAAVNAAAKAAHAENAETGDLVGTVFDGARVEIRGGAVYVSGPNLCDRYLGEPAHDEVDTGDVGHLLSTGGTPQLVLDGRAKDMVLRDAENIYPGMHEPSLQVPGVELAILVGVPGRGDDAGNENLVALVQKRRGSSDTAVRAALAIPLARMGSERPDAVVMGEIPLTGRSRKPDRKAAAALAARLLANSGSSR